MGYLLALQKSGLGPLISEGRWRMQETVLFAAPRRCEVDIESYGLAAPRKSRG